MNSLTYLDSLVNNRSRSSFSSSSSSSSSPPSAAASPSSCSPSLPSFGRPSHRLHPSRSASNLPSYAVRRPSDPGSPYPSWASSDATRSRGELPFLATFPFDHDDFDSRRVLDDDDDDELIAVERELHAVEGTHVDTRRHAARSGSEPGGDFSGAWRPGSVRGPPGAPLKRSGSTPARPRRSSGSAKGWALWGMSPAWDPRGARHTFRDASAPDWQQGKRKEKAKRQGGGEADESEEETEGLLGLQLDDEQSDVGPSRLEMVGSASSSTSVDGNRYEDRPAIASPLIPVTTDSRDGTCTDTPVTDMSPSVGALTLAHEDAPSPDGAHVASVGSHPSFNDADSPSRGSVDGENATERRSEEGYGLSDEPSPLPRRRKRRFLLYPFYPFYWLWLAISFLVRLVLSVLLSPFLAVRWLWRKAWMEGGRRVKVAEREGGEREELLEKESDEAESEDEPFDPFVARAPPSAPASELLASSRSVPVPPAPDTDPSPTPNSPTSSSLPASARRSPTLSFVLAPAPSSLKSGRISLPSAATSGSSTSASGAGGGATGKVRGKARPRVPTPSPLRRRSWSGDVMSGEKRDKVEGADEEAEEDDGAEQDDGDGEGQELDVALLSGEEERQTSEDGQAEEEEEEEEDDEIGSDDEELRRRRRQSERETEVSAAEREVGRGERPRGPQGGLPRKKSALLPNPQPVDPLLAHEAGRRKVGRGDGGNKGEKVEVEEEEGEQMEGRRNVGTTSLPDITAVTKDRSGPATATAIIDAHPSVLDEEKDVAAKRTYPTEAGPTGSIIITRSPSPSAVKEDGEKRGKTSMSPPSSATLPRPNPLHLSSLPRKILILDLDETLIHSTSRPPSYYRSRKGGGPGASMRSSHGGSLLGFEGFSLRGMLGLKGGGAGGGWGGAGGRGIKAHMVEVVLDGRSVLYHVYKRPFVDFFLRKVATWYHVVIFTASMQEYADPVIDWLDQGRGLIGGRLFRESCSYQNGSYVKRLEVVDPDLSRVCLVDNSPHSYVRNQANGIPIEGWTHDPNDEALLDLLPMLDSLRFTSDVRRVLGLRGF